MKTETKAAHTPGPWEIRCEKVFKGPRAIASISNWNDAVNGETFATSGANARLIAAAPDMLELLRRAKDRCIRGETLWVAIEDLLSRIGGQS